MKATIDRAWGVVHNKHKKRDITPPPDPEDPRSRPNLEMLPVGQDVSKKRYWVADGPCTSSFLVLSLRMHICVYLPGPQPSPVSLAPIAGPCRYRSLTRFSYSDTRFRLARFPKSLHIDQSMENQLLFTSRVFDEGGVSGID